MLKLNQMNFSLLMTNPKDGGAEILFPAVVILIVVVGLLVGAIVYWLKKDI